ncbi:MAG: alpha-mannosidase [candidate division Zixibacteria bacterium]|nr:alpha-mannosidase [candidate division Zixibacteria bacterium]
MKDEDTLNSEKNILTRTEKFSERIAQKIIKVQIPFEIEFAHTVEPVPFERRLSMTYKKIGEGERWGQTWESAWFHLQGTIPESRPNDKIVARLDFSGEGLVYDSAGRMLQGISNGSVFASDFSRDIVPLFDRCAGGEKVELWVEAAASGLFGVFTEPDPAPDSPKRYGLYDAVVNAARLCLFEDTARHFWLDLKIVRGFLKHLPENSPRRGQLLEAVDKTIDIFEGDEENIERCRDELKAELYRPAEKTSLSVAAVGHAHIDTAWLWPVCETVRKCARTFASQLALIEKYPDYIFGASQPQHYQFVKEHYPELYQRIKKAVAAGRWELQGGMWVEADCNLTGGESLIRQILHGKNFFKDEFGLEVDNLWLPDVFGYSAALPQILQKSGIKYFLTQKLSWNQYNVFPYHTFIWRGIDGSEVLTHFPPENNYNSQLGTDFLLPAVENFKEKDIIGEFLSLFGVGDGGGGPKEENIELGLRMADLENAPRVRFAAAKDFFEKLERHRARLQTWEGELYLELHRGTFTTQALVKKANRRLEHKLRAVEMLYSCLPLERYPAGELDAVWKKVLINQFHDILPGSSITKVYETTHREHREALKQCNGLISRVADGLFERDANSLTLFNSLGFPFEDAVELPSSWRGCGVIDEKGQRPAQELEGERTVALVNVEPYSFTTLYKLKESAPVSLAGDDLVLENDLVRYEFDKDGILIEAYDKEKNRDILAAGGKGNVFTLYEDRPKNWDAWDIDITYEEMPLENAREAGTNASWRGSVRRGLRFKLTIGQSEIEQTVYLTSNCKRLDFVTRVVWRENHKMLRVAFPVNIKSDRAAFDIQYGYLMRNTHRETSWDKAKFEVPAHRYADLSDDNYGTALLNDCKYGYKVLGNVLDLNLLRSPTYPDPDADRGRHEFTYSLLPHSGDLTHSDVQAHAARLNQGLEIFEGYKNVKTVLPARVSGEGLSLEVIKKAEQENCLVIRIVETHGRESKGTLTVEDTSARLVETDLMEWREFGEHDCSQPMELTLKPFEILTFKLKTGWH